jgi:uncharacterized protein YjbI with pentapeptide repeats
MESAQKPAGTAKRCGYLDCPFDAEEGHDLCIFHLPIEKKKDPAKFWTHFANLYVALVGTLPQDKQDEARKMYGFKWKQGQADAALIERYRPIAQGMKDLWLFIGFVFPDMSGYHNLYGLLFGTAGFRGAQFFGVASFGGAQFTGAADFSHAQFTGSANFRGAQFLGAANFSEARFTGAANFSEARFTYAADFGHAQFTGSADFSGAQFTGSADFGHAQFTDAAGFPWAQFTGAAYFSHAQFTGSVNFLWAEFTGAAYFGRAQFTGSANFWQAEFMYAADFSEAQFTGSAHFSGAKFTSAVRFTRAEFGVKPEDKPVIDFTGCQLLNCLSFDGTQISDKALVLLWKLDFIHGRSDVELDPKTGKGTILEPAGMVEFKDIFRGMDRISFLHTDVYSDRLHFRFFDVKWQADPGLFLHDAGLVKGGVEAAKGAFGGWFGALPEMFHQPFEPEADSEEHSDWTRGLAELLRLDVERVAREIRRYYEDYGNYSDAGDYHIAEMEYRRAGARGFTWFVLTLYNWVSRYGEVPSRALWWLGGIVLIPALVYPFSGIVFQHCDLQLLMRFEPRSWCPTLLTFLKAILFSVVGLVPGYFRVQGEMFGSGSTWTTVLMTVQAIMGVTVLTLFLLALRRRFRR